VAQFGEMSNSAGSITAGTLTFSGVSIPRAAHRSPEALNGRHRKSLVVVVTHAAEPTHEVMLAVLSSKTRFQTVVLAWVAYKFPF
jgi:hypothetical protein